MKVTAHILVGKDYSRGIDCSQCLDSILGASEEHNEDHYGEGYLSQDKQYAVVTVEFEVSDLVFKRSPVPMSQGAVIESNKKDSQE